MLSWLGILVGVVGVFGCVELLVCFEGCWLVGFKVGWLVLLIEVDWLSVCLDGC